MDLITGLARERHMATLFITHDLALAADYCDRIVVMHAGHAVESAPTRSAVRRAAPPVHRAADELLARRTQHHRQPGAGARQPARPAPRRPAGLPLRRTLRARQRTLPQRAPAPATGQRARAWPAGIPLHEARTAAPEAGACLRPLLAGRIAAQALCRRRPARRDAACGRRCVADDRAPAKASAWSANRAAARSTLVRLLARLLDPSEGRIVFAGERPGRHPARCASPARRSAARSRWCSRTRPIA